MDLTYQDYSAFGFNRLIKYRGVFDFDAFYKFMVKWIKDHDFDFYEKRVWDKPPYKIYELEGRKKINFYCMFLLLPEIWVLDEKKVDVVKDGHVKHMSEGMLKININGGFITDYDGDFEKSPGLKGMEKFLNGKILYHENLLKYFDYMDYYLYGFMTEVKAFLDMDTATNAY